MSKKTIIAALAALAAACGGGGGTQRTTKSFSYGPATTALSADELTAAGDLSSGIAASAQFKASPDGDMAASLATLPDALDGAMGTASFALRQGLTADSPAERAVASATARLVATPTATVTPDCWVATATSVTFNHCQAGETSTDGTSLNVTLDGSVSKKGTDEVKWDLTATASGTTAQGNVSGSIHYFGDLTITATTIDGFAESDKSVTIAATDVHGTASITNSVDFASVTFTDQCVTSGSVEAKRIGAINATSSQGSVNARVDGALKFTWQGCADVTVQHSI